MAHLMRRFPQQHRPCTDHPFHYMLRLLFLYFLLHPVLGFPHLSEEYGPWLNLVTEPTFQAAIVTAETNNLTSTLNSQNVSASDDHIFVTLRTFRGPGPWGPQIFDAQGNLVFYSDPHQKGALPSLAYQDPHPCEFSPSPQVDDFDATTENDYFNEYAGSFMCVSKPIARPRGHMVSTPIVYDSHYEMAPRGDLGNDLHGSFGSADGHEFRMLPGGRAYITSAYVKKQWDLGQLKEQHEIFGPQPTPNVNVDFIDTTTNEESKTWIYDACFQEVDIPTKSVTFSWCCTDWLDLSDTLRPYVGPYPKEGPFDLIHINSVDRDAHGDYLISIKWFSQLVKVAGKHNAVHKPGTPIWRLGGKNSSFASQDENLPFFWQHSARFQKQPPPDTKFNGGVHDGASSSNTEIISVYDTHCTDSSKQTCKTPSSGKLIRLDFNSDPPTANMLQQYAHPAGKRAWAAGNMQVLPNGNVWVGYGHLAEATEFDYSGNVIKHYQLGASRFCFAYRVVRGHWRGQPKWSPKVMAYSRDCGPRDDVSSIDDSVSKAINETMESSKLHLYVSWNGDTETKTWRVEVSRAGHDGTDEDEWEELGDFERTGFETHIILPFQAGSSSPGVAAADSGTTSGQRTLKRLPTKVRLTALTSSGDPISHGVNTTSIFVPKPHLIRGDSPTCFQESCQPQFAYNATENDTERCILVAAASPSEDDLTDSAAALVGELHATRVPTGSITSLSTAKPSVKTQSGDDLESHVTSVVLESDGRKSRLHDPASRQHLTSLSKSKPRSWSLHAFPAMLGVAVIILVFLAFQLRRSAG